MDTREDYPRVSVDSAQDWKNIRARYREAAIESIQAQVAANRDLNRDALIAHMEEFIDSSFTFAQTNLRVNGQKFDQLDASGREMEPFDEALDRQIWSLASNRLQWHKRIAEVRRTIPKETQATITKLHEQHQAIDGLPLKPYIDDIEDPPEEDAVQRERIEEVIYQTSALVNELDQTIVQQRERGVKAKLVEKEIEALKS